MKSNGQSVTVAPKPEALIRKNDRRSRRQKLTTTAGGPIEWEEVGFQTVDAGGISYTWPKQRMAALARPGMIASIPNLGVGRILLTTPEHCHCVMEDGQVWPATWGEVSLECVRPDPDYVTPYPTIDYGAEARATEHEPHAITVRRRAENLDPALARLLDQFIRKHFSEADRLSHPLVRIALETDREDGNIVDVMIGSLPCTEGSKR